MADSTQVDSAAWCAACRVQVAEYLRRQPGLSHGKIGDWPAWHLAPHLSVWTVESLSSPSQTGWWVLCGDLPTAHCAADNCRQPRLAVIQIAESWLAALASTQAGAATIGDTDLEVSVRPLLEERAKLLLSLAADPEDWPE